MRLRGRAQKQGKVCSHASADTIQTCLAQHQVRPATEAEVRFAREIRGEYLLFFYKSQYKKQPGRLLLGVCGGIRHLDENHRINSSIFFALRLARAWDECYL
jgi:hypothetical protein